MLHIAEARRENIATISYDLFSWTENKDTLGKFKLLYRNVISLCLTQQIHARLSLIVSNPGEIQASSNLHVPLSLIQHCLTFQHLSDCQSSITYLLQKPLEAELKPRRRKVRLVALSLYKPSSFWNCRMNI